MLSHPVGIYINWASYDELSDNVELTETLALQQLAELLRLRARGVRLDYYLMDAFWYAPDGGYRTWRTPHWPDGPDRWLDGCTQGGVQPGLWVTANTLCHMALHPAWAESFDPEANALCLFTGGFLAHFVESLHQWYARGVRLFKFDFANFAAATPALKRVLLPSEIREANLTAWRGALAAFKAAHPEVLLLAYNGYEEVSMQYGTAAPYRKAIDLRWLTVFDAMYCGDPRPADVPAMQFWRAKDIYSDHMVRYYLDNGLPAARIDNSGFMVGTTGTCYFRGTAAWQGMLLLSMARGGWANTYYGNLDLLDDAKADWFARAQALYFPLQAGAEFSPFGGMPGEAAPYGFAFRDGGDAVLTVVNPAQRVAILGLPVSGAGRLLFCDAGLAPLLAPGRITLGPEGMAVIGYGRFANPAYELGVQEDVVIPRAIAEIAVWSSALGESRAATTLSAPQTGTLRLVFQQRDAGGPMRLSGGSPPTGTSLGQLLTITVSQGERPIPTRINYDKAIWSGLSWAVAEVDVAALDPAQPVTVVCATTDSRRVQLECQAFHVLY
jgi:hypothetical protein